MTDVRQMDAKLMGAPGMRFQKKQTETSFLIRLKKSPVGARRLAGRVHGHPPALRSRGDLGERFFDASLVTGGPPRDDRQIGLVHTPLKKQLMQAAKGLGVTAEQQDAGGVSVQAMGERRKAR